MEAHDRKRVCEESKVWDKRSKDHWIVYEYVMKIHKICHITNFETARV